MLNNVYEDDWRLTELPGKITFDVGDVLTICTPRGGGFLPEEEKSHVGQRNRVTLISLKCRTLPRSGAPTAYLRAALPPDDSRLSTTRPTLWDCAGAARQRPSARGALFRWHHGRNT